MKLIDPTNGQPFKIAELTREISAPSLMSVRQVWDTHTIAVGLTPDRLASLIAACNIGDTYSYLTLAEEIEERDPHYAAVLGARKRAITGVKPIVESASDLKADIDLADAIRELIDAPEFIRLERGLLDAIAKGYSVVEIIYRRDADMFRIAEYRWRDPRFFIFDKNDGYTLRLKDEQDPVYGIKLKPYKFVCHVPDIKNGLPARSGIARLVAVAHMCKSYTLRSWMRFAEVFGMPLRVGKYNSQTAVTDDIRKLLSAVSNLGTDAAAAIPDDMQIEFVSPGNVAGGADLFSNLAEWLDKQVSKAVLGQTMTTDDGSSLSQAKVHDEVRQDIVDSDARDLEMTLNRDLVIPYINLNFGPQKQYPKLRIPVKRHEDIKTLVEALKILVPFGLEVEQSIIRDKLNLPDPEEGAKLLEATAPSPPIPQNNPLNRALNFLQQQQPHPPVAPDKQVERLAKEVDPIIAEWSKEVANRLSASNDLQALGAWLTNGQAWADLPTASTVQAIANAITASNLAGRYDIGRAS